MPMTSVTQSKNNTVRLMLGEDPGIDPDPMVRIFTHMTEKAAEQKICDILEGISEDVSQARAAYLEHDYTKLSDPVERLCQRAGTIGLTSLSRVAADVSICMMQGDRTAIGATMARLLRVADRSLAEVWNRA